MSCVKIEEAEDIVTFEYKCRAHETPASRPVLRRAKTLKLSSDDMSRPRTKRQKTNRGDWLEVRRSAV
jgi:hypothetical protein